MKNKKSLAVTLGAVALTAALTVGGTLAYLTDQTTEVQNTFTSSKGIDTTLTEEFDETAAKEYVPGQILTKEPVITNKSTNLDIYTAMSVEYEVENETKTAAEFNAYAYISNKEKTATDIAATNEFNTAQWTLIAKSSNGKELYMYNAVLTYLNEDGANVTKPLFKSVKVNPEIEEKSVTSGTTSRLPNFNINLLGYSVQKDTFTATQAKAQLIALANSGVNNTDGNYFIAV